MRDGIVDPNDKVEDSFKVGISQGQTKQLGIGIQNYITNSNVWILETCLILIFR